MHLKRILTAAIIAGAWAVQAQTTTNPAPATATREITLQEAIQMALENNLDVQIQRFGPAISQFNLNGSYAYYEPSLGFNFIHSFNSRPGRFNPDLGLRIGESESASDIFSIPSLGGVLPTGTRYSIDAATVGTEVQGVPRKDYSGDWGINVTQPILRDAWIDQGRAQILINKRMLKSSEFAFVGQVMQTVSAVEQAYYNLVAARENVKVAEKALELAKRTLLENRKKVEVGALAQLDEREAESQVASSEADLLGAQRDLALRENVLKNLLTSDYPKLHGIQFVPSENLVPVPMAFDVQESWRTGLAQRPDLQQARIDLDRRDINLRYQKNQLFPALDLIGSYGHNGLNSSYGRVFDDLTKDQNPSYSYGFRLSIPLGNARARNTYKATKAEKEQALLQIKKLEQDVMVQIDDAIKRVQTSFQRIEATRQARIFAVAALDAEQKKLENGKSTSFQVLQFQQRRTQAGYAEIAALSDYNNARSQLALVEGTTLERHHLNVSVK